jgi:hypothetical protein
MDEDRLMLFEAARQKSARAIVAMAANRDLYEQACSSRVVLVKGQTATYYVLMGNLSYSRVVAEGRLSKLRVVGKNRWHFKTFTLSTSNGDTATIYLALDSEPWDAAVIPSHSTVGVPIGCTCMDWRWRSTKHTGSASTVEEESPMGYARNGCKHMIAVAQAVADHPTDLNRE